MSESGSNASEDQQEGNTASICDSMNYPEGDAGGPEPNPTSGEAGGGGKRMPNEEGSGGTSPPSPARRANQLLAFHPEVSVMETHEVEELHDEAAEEQLGDSITISPFSRKASLESSVLTLTDEEAEHIFGELEARKAKEEQEGTAEESRATPRKIERGQSSFVLQKENKFERYNSINTRLPSFEKKLQQSLEESRSSSSLSRNSSKKLSRHESIELNNTSKGGEPGTKPLGRTHSLPERNIQKKLSTFVVEEDNEFRRYSDVTAKHDLFEQKLQQSFDLKRGSFAKPKKPPSETETEERVSADEGSRKQRRDSDAGFTRSLCSSVASTSAPTKIRSLNTSGGSDPKSLLKSFKQSLFGSVAKTSQRSLNAEGNLNTEDEEIIILIAKQLRSNFLFLSLDDESIINVARQFEVVEYELGSAIIEQGSAGESVLVSQKEQHMYYYILVEGECVVVKDGKQVHGKYGIVEKGTSFGEDAILFNNTERAATIVASKPCPNTKTIIAYRLKDTIFREAIGPEEMANLQHHIRDIQPVVDTLSGVSTKVNKGTILRPYKPSGIWLAKQWSGTVLQYVWRKVLVMMVLTALFGFIVSQIVGDISPDTEHPLLDQLELIGGWWLILSPLTTFVSTFFLAETFRSWKNFYKTTRVIQGFFNDVSFILASNAKRNENDGTLTEGAVEALTDIVRLLTLTHQLFWCTIVERFQTILTPEGISYLLSKKLITQKEYASLIEIGQLHQGICGVGHNAALTWLASRVNMAIEKGHMDIDHYSRYEMFTRMRCNMAKVPTLYAGRMPLAYVHFVHLLVTVLVLVSPIALFPKYWYWSVIAVGILTLFYDGVFKLSLMFLDPVDNDKQHQRSRDQTVGFDIGVLIRECHNGIMCYKNCAAGMPQY